MSQDEIVKMARQAGLVRTGDKWVEPARWGVTELVHFATLAAAAEREAIAKMVEGLFDDPNDAVLEFIVDAIRARGNK